nr:immunoglobulin light chain junction region [Macaca mulatta]
CQQHRSWPQLTF